MTAKTKCAQQKIKLQITVLPKALCALPPLGVTQRSPEILRTSNGCASFHLSARPHHPCMLEKALDGDDEHHALHNAAMPWNSSTHGWMGKTITGTASTLVVHNADDRQSGIGGRRSDWHSMAGDTTTQISATGRRISSLSGQRIPTLPGDPERHRWLLGTICTSWRRSLPAAASELLDLQGKRN